MESLYYSSQFDADPVSDPMPERVPYSFDNDPILERVPRSNVAQFVALGWGV